MRDGKPWTLLESYALTKTSKKHLPVLAEKIGRPLEEVQAKYKELLTIVARLYEKERKKLLKQGLTEEEAVGLLLIEKNWRSILKRSVRLLYLRKE